MNGMMYGCTEWPAGRLQAPLCKWARPARGPPPIHRLAPGREERFKVLNNVPLRLDPLTAWLQTRCLSRNTPCMWQVGVFEEEEAAGIPAPQVTPRIDCVRAHVPTNALDTPMWEFLSHMHEDTHKRTNRRVEGPGRFSSEQPRGCRPCLVFGWQCRLVFHRPTRDALEAFGAAWNALELSGGPVKPAARIRIRTSVNDKHIRLQLRTRVFPADGQRLCCSAFLFLSFHN